MPSFRVQICRADFFDLEVEADDETEARDAALKVICQSEDPIADYFSHCDGFETTDCNEVTS